MLHGANFLHESATIKRFEVRSERGKEEGKRERGGLFREGKVTPNDRSIAALTLADIPRGEEQIPPDCLRQWTLEVPVKLIIMANRYKTKLQSTI